MFLGEVLTLDIELNLGLPAFDVEPVVGCRLTPVGAHDVTGDVGELQAPVPRLHHPLAVGHGQVLAPTRPQDGRTRLSIHQADEFGHAPLLHADRRSAGRHGQDGGSHCVGEKETEWEGEEREKKNRR